MKLGAKKLQEWLDGWRKNKNPVKKIKPSHFAKSIGKSPSTITRILSGENCPDLETINLINKKTKGYIVLADWLSQVKKVPEKKRPAVRRCRVCRCTDNKACMTKAGPCYWVKGKKNLCSACDSQ